MAATKGILIIDKQGGVQLRVGDDAKILPITAMAYWNNKLVVGCGSAAGSQGNLAYFDKTAYTETGNISDSTYAANTIASEFRTKMDDLGMPNVAKKLDYVTIVYYDNTAWDDMTMALQYRFVKVTTSTTVQGGTSATSSWTDIYCSGETAAITLDVQTGVTYKTVNVGSDPGLAFQSRVTADGFSEIVGIIMHFDILSERQQ
jgi:hypothetical protein